MFLSMMFTMITAAATPEARPEDLFALDGSQCIMEEEHFGIVNGKMTIGVNFKDVAAIQGLWAPPYASSAVIRSWARCWS